MWLEKDYEEFIKLLNKHKAKYCIIDSYAVAFHAKPRYTKDIDILIEATSQNAKKIKRGLDDLIKSKRLSQRIEDKIDLEVLRKAKEKQTS